MTESYNQAHRIIKQLDTILDVESLHHGPTCKRVEGTAYFHMPCNCGLGKLEELQLTLVEPWLEANKAAE